MEGEKKKRGGGGGRRPCSGTGYEGGAVPFYSLKPHGSVT